MNFQLDNYLIDTMTKHNTFFGHIKSRLKTESISSSPLTVSEGKLRRFQRKQITKIQGMVWRQYLKTLKQRLHQHITNSIYSYSFQTNEIKVLWFSFSIILHLISLKETRVYSFILTVWYFSCVLLICTL